jgi:hypothetical protein
MLIYRKRTRGKVERTLLAFALGALFLSPLSAAAEDLLQADRRFVAGQMQERGRAAARFLALWFAGAPPSEQAREAAAFLAAEANIAVFFLDGEEELKRTSLLWGQEVTELTLPVLLMERHYHIPLGVERLFAQEGEE